jgi:hypothetical protein
MSGASMRTPRRAAGARGGPGDALPPTGLRAVVGGSAPA